MMQRNHFLRLILLAATLFSAFLIITLSIIPKPTASALPTLAVLPSETASLARQVEESEAIVAILPTNFPTETTKPISASTDIPTQVPTRRSTNTPEVIDLPTNTSSPVTETEEVVAPPADTSSPSVDAPEVASPDTDTPPQQPTAQTFPTVDIRPTEQDQVQSDPVNPVPPTEAPIDMSQLSETERALFQRVQEQNRVGVIVGLAVPFQNASSPSAQELQAQQATIQQARSSLMQNLAAYDVEVLSNSTNWAIPFVALEVDEAALRALIASPDVTTIDENGENTISLSSSAPVIRAPQAWGMGYQGNGWYVAILDTGVERTHSFLGGRVGPEACFSGGGSSAYSLCPNGQTVQYGTGAASPSVCWNLSGGDEGCAHGTHVAGIAAGYQSGSFSGIAPNANIIGVQVFSWGLSAYDSDIISGLNYVYYQRNSYPIAAVNLSLGDASRGSSSHCDYESYSMTSIFQQLRSAGIAPVVATGNNGYANFISFPACISYAVSVGASTDSDTSASFSNDAVNIQELFAPGASITSSVYPSGTDTWDGTSMAAPHVTGAFAVYRQFSPSASVDTIVNRFRSTGKPISISGGTVPRINLQAAILGYVPTPDNDLRNNAAPIVTLPYNRAQNNIADATVTAGDPAFCTSVQNTVWYRYTAPSSQTLTFSTVGSNYDTVLAVFDANTLASLDCDDQSGGNNTSLLNLSVTQGNTYLIGIGSWVYAAPGSAALNFSVTGSIVPTPPPPRPSGIGIYYNGNWYLRDSASPGSPNWMPQYGGFGTPIVGDWNGNGTATLGIYNPSNGQWYLRNRNDSGSVDYPVFLYGGFGTPVVGDWNGDGVDTIGLYDPSGGMWYLRNYVNSGGVSYSPFQYGGFGIPVVGDWDGNGSDTVGVYNPANGMWYLRNSNSSGSANYVFQYGGFGIPVVGDWDGNGSDTVGVYNPADGRWYLRNSNSSGAPSYAPFVYGGFGVPVVGTWSINGTFGADGAMASFSGDWEAIMEENRPTPTPTATATETATETATVSPTATATGTSTLEPTPTETETLTPTEEATETLPPSETPTEVATEPPLPTATPEPTATLAPPSETPIPTATPVPPTATVPPTNTVPPSETPIPTATSVPPTATVPPTNTVPPSDTPAPTEVPQVEVTEEAQVGS